MQCHTCRTEFEGNFCSNCGASANHESPAKQFLTETIQPAINLAKVLPLLVRPTDFASAIRDGRFTTRMACGFYLGFSFVNEIIKASGWPVTSFNERISVYLTEDKVQPIVIFLFVPLFGCLIVLGRTYLTHFCARWSGGRARLSESFSAALPYGAIGDLVRGNLIQTSPINQNGYLVQIAGFGAAAVLVYAMTKTLSELHNVSAFTIFVALLGGGWVSGILFLAIFSVVLG